MKFIVIASKKDKAGMNILSFLNPKIQRIIFDKEIVYAEDIDKNLDADLIIFASKHQGKTPQMLSIHAPGNWKKADFGGVEEKVCLASASILKTFFSELNENIPEGWNATMECTHHGPLIKKPCLFIEVGSNEKDWENKTGAEAIAKTIENSIKIINQSKLINKSPSGGWWGDGGGNKVVNEIVPAIAIGGPHYCPNFNKIQLNSKYAISHVIPEYIFPINEEIIKEALSKTQEEIKTAIIDWKGCGNSPSRQEVIKILESQNLKILRTDQIEK